MTKTIQRTETVTKVYYTVDCEDKEIELFGAYDANEAYVELVKIHKKNVGVHKVTCEKRIYKMPFDQFKHLASVEVE